MKWKTQTVDACKEYTSVQANILIHIFGVSLITNTQTHAHCSMGCHALCRKNNKPPKTVAAKKDFEWQIKGIHTCTWHTLSAEPTE